LEGTPIEVSKGKSIQQCLFFAAFQGSWLREENEMTKKSKRPTITSVLGVNPSTAEEVLANLTPRERQVAELLASGRTVRDIAAELGISPKTLDIHRAKIKIKLRAKTAIDIARFVFAEKLGPTYR
jgi:DNA-binding NarL/FixJ family response regulator